MDGMVFWSKRAEPPAVLHWVDLSVGLQQQQQVFLCWHAVCDEL